MELAEYARIAAVEDDHWWYRGTRTIAAELLAPWLGRGLRILDAGCGPGGNGAWLSKHGTVVGIDIEAEALRFVQERGRGHLPVRASLGAIPLADASVDVVLALTVLYSVPDDELAVRELTRVLRPGGALLTVEPAFPSLRRAHDATVHGRRRYRRAGLAAIARAHGLEVRRVTYAYSFLAPPAAALAVMDRLRPRAEPSGQSDVERRALDRVFAPLAVGERAALRHLDVPFGTSVVMLATKP